MFLFDLFYLVIWDDLDLYYAHKAQEMLLNNVSDTIHADSLALFALNPRPAGGGPKAPLVVFRK